jgi:large subunit ribosomal protein L10e
MAKKRKFCAYRALERPYTRFSKFKKMSFVKAKPVCRIVRFITGPSNKKFAYSLKLISKSSLHIRDNAIESARLTANRLLEPELGKNGFRMAVRVYPHHILRENPLAAGAGADRMSTGMKCSFGKTIGVAARVKKGQAVFSIEVNKNGLELAKRALKRASYKLPANYHTEIEEVKKSAEKNKPAKAVSAKTETPKKAEA